MDLPNLQGLSRESFEALNRLAIKVYAVQGRHVETVLAKLADASTREFLQFTALLRDMRLGQIATLANLVRQKLHIIHLFRTLTSSRATREHEVHALIEQNPWIADKRYDVVASDVTLATYLNENLRIDPELGRRPDLIAKRVPHENRLVLIELKRPGVPLRGAHVGQVLEYKGLIQAYRPNVVAIDCYVFGYEKHPGLVLSSDVKIQTFSELVSVLEDEYREYLRVLEDAEHETASGTRPFLSRDRRAGEGTAVAAKNRARA